jgi:hypothetical protein
MSVDMNEDLLDQLVIYLDDADNPDDAARLWKGLCFMEANGLDPALRYHELHGYLTSDLSPVPGAERLTHEDEERIVLALRGRIRRTLGLPALSDEERRRWRLVPRPPHKWRPDQMEAKRTGKGFGPALDPDKVRADIAREMPELMHAMGLISAHNAKAGGEWDKEVSVLWLLHELRPMIARLYPDISAMDASDLAQHIIDGAERSAKASIEASGANE